MATAKRLIFIGCDKSPRCLLETVNIPQLQVGEILCKIRLAAICKSDLLTLGGHRAQKVPSYLGHECIAEVVSHRRSDVVDLQPGQRIVFSVCDSCCNCSRCLRGLPQKCSSLYKYGHEEMMSASSKLSGSYGSHIILRAGTAVVAIPDEIPDCIAAPINCSLATMVCAVSKVKRDASQTVLIQGCGALGLYGCALLHDYGFSKIICSDRRINRLQVIRNFGGIGMLSGEEQEKLKPDSIDVVIEACGSKDVVDIGMSLLRPGGTYIFVGMVHPNSKLDLTAETLIRKCLTITGVHNYAPCHLEEAVAFVTRTSKKYPWADLGGPSFPLREFDRAIQEADRNCFHRVFLHP